MNAIAALKVAVRTHLIGDAGLVALLGGTRVFDEVPRGQATPYVVFAAAAARENGTSSDRGHIVELTLDIWSRQGGAKEALAVAERLETLLDDAALTLAGHRLITLRVASAETRRQPERDLTRASLRLRAVTEVI